MLSPEWRVVLGILAVYRLAQLFAFDEGPGHIFERIRAWGCRFDDTGKIMAQGTWSRFVSCPFCTGVWFAAFAVLLIVLPSLVGDLFLLWQAVAGGQAFMEGLTHARESD